ncbi:YjcQ family protein [Planococcus lenghuensis]|uniref:YjcQ protein n=1 Tax=Planococcus lenghuensis TaxID=2213202 RepID=A0A1Q2L5A8_9BACL|nr:YjcQ family protein [Planococcus lenghuensis]AQQ55554.1 hypothetical protein B0X71_20480 [Planococcus lenghuensis]
MNKKKLRYAILKEIEQGNNGLTEEKLKIRQNEFDETIRFLDRENYLIGITYADDRPIISRVVLTEKGEAYLEQNSALGRAYKGLKEIRDWIR